MSGGAGTTNEKEEKEKQMLQELENLISIFFEVTAKQVISLIEAMRVGLLSVLNEKSEPPKDGDDTDQWANINEKYERFSS